MKKRLTLKSAEILIPKKGTDLNKWAVVACDQHTSNPQYWENLKEYIGGAKSSLNLILPECYLGGSLEDGMTDAIVSSMNEYVCSGVFQSVFGSVYVERRLSNGKLRKGLVFAVDLEDYSFRHEDKTLVRASEKTVLERIPPRLRIRERCPLELPHIMLLYDDSDDLVLSGLQGAEKEKLYDFELNCDGGHIKGYLIKDTSLLESGFNALLKKSGSAMLFAVGDGNHSLATAKEAWEREKKKENPDEKARYALVEAVNIYSEALDFEPIHRAVFGVDVEKFISELRKTKFDGEKDDYVLTFGDNTQLISLPRSPIITVGGIDGFISKYIEKNGGSVDYIHGDDELKKLCGKNGSVGIFMKAMKKEDLFPYVEQFGSLPKKTFSMGEANDKRYYMEARYIKQIQANTKGSK